MAKEYFDRLNVLLQRATSDKFDDVNLQCKHFFSGAAVYANGKICISLTPVGFAVKLPEESRLALLEQTGTKPLRYFPKSPIKKEYVVLPEDMLKDTKTLRHWVGVSIEYVLTLAKPVRKGRKKKRS